jgi:hypothetical protein
VHGTLSVAYHWNSSCSVTSHQFSILLTLPERDSSSAANANARSLSVELTGDSISAACRLSVSLGILRSLQLQKRKLVELRELTARLQDSHGNCPQASTAMDFSNGQSSIGKGVEPKPDPESSAEVICDRALSDGRQGYVFAITPNTAIRLFPEEVAKHESLKDLHEVSLKQVASLSLPRIDRKAHDLTPAIDRTVCRMVPGRFTHVAEVFSGIALESRLQNRCPMT